MSEALDSSSEPAASVTLAVLISVSVAAAWRLFAQIRSPRKDFNSDGSKTNSMESAYPISQNDMLEVEWKGDVDYQLAVNCRKLMAKKSQLSCTLGLLSLFALSCQAPVHQDPSQKTEPQNQINTWETSRLLGRPSVWERIGIFATPATG